MDRALYDHPDVYDRLYAEKDYKGRSTSSSTGLPNWASAAIGRL